MRRAIESDNAAYNAGIDDHQPADLSSNKSVVNEQRKEHSSSERRPESSSLQLLHQSDFDLTGSLYLVTISLFFFL